MCDLNEFFDDREEGSVEDLDSLGLIELNCYIEDRLGISLSLDWISDISNIESILNDYKK